MDAESDVGGCALGDRSECESEGHEFSNEEDSFLYEECDVKPEASWARDRRELEASKLSFLRATRQQQQVDESVRLLLRRLEELPSKTPLEKQGLECDDTSFLASECDTVVSTDRGLAASCSESDAVLSGKQPQRLAAVAQLLRKGMDMAGAGMDTSGTGYQETSPTSPVLPTKKSARTRSAGRHGAVSHAQLANSKRRHNGTASQKLAQQQQPLARKSAVASGRTADLSAPVAPLVAPPVSMSPTTLQQDLAPTAAPSAVSVPAAAQACCNAHHSSPVQPLHSPRFGTTEETAEPACSQATLSNVDDHVNGSLAPCSMPCSMWSPATPKQDTPRADLKEDGLGGEGCRGGQIGHLYGAGGQIGQSYGGGGQTGQWPSRGGLMGQSHGKGGQIGQLVGGGAQKGQSGLAVISSMDPFMSPPSKKFPPDDAGYNPKRRPSCEIIAGSDPFSPGMVGQSPSNRDASLGPQHVTVGNDWCGWTVQTSNDGELFYHHEQTRTSQWRTPQELRPVLGEWIEARDESGHRYWANDRAGMSCWSDPRCTANIFQAAYEGDKFFVQMYIYGKGNLDAVDSSGCTALHYACASNNSEDMAAYLLESGASADVPDLAKGRPLHWACRYSHSDAARLLLEARADPDRQDVHGDSPLHLAAGVDCKGAVQHLVASRARTKLRNRKQGATHTPLEVAVAAGSHGSAAIIREYEQELAWQAGQGSLQVFGPTDDQEVCSRRDRPSPVITRPYSGSPTQQEELEPLSPVKAVARVVARPLIAGVQWLANRVSPLDDSRSKCRELGGGTPKLEKGVFSRLVAAIPHGALEQVLRDDHQCFDDPPGFKHYGNTTDANPYGLA